jgi:hypothetical protein
MGTGVAGATDARSLEVWGDGSGSSSGSASLRQEKFDARAERRAFALDASIEDVLIAAADRASDRLKHERPEFSAATLNRFACFIPALFVVGALMALLTSMSTIVLCTLAVLPAAFRILIAMAPSREFSSFASATKDGDLPVYTIIAPLHREARVVDQLLSAIEQLDYPAEKLDVIVVVEADEPATRAAITQRKHRLPITVVPAPPAEPRTKPKALNIALELARGSFVVIYDAEPQPASLCLTGFPLLRGRPCLRTGAAMHRQRRDLARPLFYRRICRTLRRLPSEACHARSAPASWWFFKPFQDIGSTRGRRLGSLQRHRGRRPRHAPRAFWLPVRGDRFNDL